MVGYLSGIAVSYAINVLAVFKDRQSAGGALVRYVLAYLVALGLQMGLLEIFVRLGTSPTISNAIAIVVVVVLNFFAIRRWVFQKSP
jgi:putative flippase GtrA